MNNDVFIAYLKAHKPYLYEIEKNLKEIKESQSGSGNIYIKVVRRSIERVQVTKGKVFNTDL